MTSHGIHVHQVGAVPNGSLLEFRGFGLERFLAEPLPLENGRAIAPDRPGQGSNSASTPSPRYSQPGGRPEEVTPGARQDGSPDDNGDANGGRAGLAGNGGRDTRVPAAPRLAYEALGLR